jgi:WD40 repeat protein
MGYAFGEWSLMPTPRPFSKSLSLRGRTLSLGWTQDSRQILWIDGSRYLRRLQLETGKDEIVFVSPLSMGWHGLALDGQAREAIFVSRQGILEGWNCDREIKAWSIDNAARFESGHVALSQDCRWLAVDRDSTSITIYDLQRKTEWFTLPAERTAIWSLAWGPDANKLAVGLSDGGLVLWDLAAVRIQLDELAFGNVEPTIEPSNTTEENTHNQLSMSLVQETVASFSNMAATFLRASKLHAAEGTLREVLAAQQSVLPTDSEEIAVTWIDLAVVLGAHSTTWQSGWIGIKVGC